MGVILFGAIFFATGLASMGICIGVGLSQNQFSLIVFGMLFGFSFAAAGVAIMGPVIKNMTGLKKAKQTGQKFQGIIIEYQDDMSMQINGVPVLVIVVRCIIGGQVRDFIYNTRQTSESKYPLGAFCDLYLYLNEPYVDEKTIIMTEESRRVYQGIMAELQRPDSVLPVTPPAASPVVPPVASPVNVDDFSGSIQQDTAFSYEETPRYLNGKPVDKYGNPL